MPEGAPVVLYVGRIAAEKGIEHLVEAARRMPEAHVVLVGPDDRHAKTGAGGISSPSPLWGEGRVRGPRVRGQEVRDQEVRDQDVRGQDVKAPRAAPAPSAT